MLDSESSVSSDHEFLYHYTDFESFRGMMETKELWASHYKTLNDTKEIERFKPVLTKALSRSLLDFFQQHSREDKAFRMKAKNAGGIRKGARKDAENLVNSNYEVAFEDQSGNLKEAFSPPYIVSFCSHDNHGSYVQKNGLLSQWRAYGANGVCVVFNTKKLEKLLQQEYEYYDYVSVSLSSVLYEEAEYLNTKHFRRLVEYLRTIYLAYYLEVIQKDSDEVLEAYSKNFELFFRLATRAKHYGFREEQEIRIIAAPTPRVLKQRPDYKIDEQHSKLIQKDWFEFPKGSGKRRIKLNTKPDSRRLPIERVIIAPMIDQHELEAKVRALIGEKKIKVNRCKTPFIG